MKKTLLLTVFLVLLMGMMSSLFAQNIVTIGDGTTTNTTTGAPAPYGTWYKAFRQQLLYKASDFTAAGATPGLISALSFNVQALDTCSPMLNYTIRLKATTQEALTTTFELGDYTTVWHSDEFMPTLDWNLHTLTTPFLWDGTSNLLVDISTDVMGAISHNALVYYTATAYNSSLRFQSDSANGSTGITGTTAMNRSNIRFLMSPPSPDPLFMVSPTAKNFGDVVLGFTPNQNFTIFNSGGGTLTINSISISGSNFFSLTNLPTLPAQLVMGSPATFKVVYAPTAAGDHTATVTITDNLRQTHTIALSGHGVDTTIYDLSYAQAFDEVAIPALPLGWSSIYQANVTTGYVRTVTTTPQSAPNCVTIYNSNDAAAIAMLIAPPLSTALAANTLRVKFYGKGSTSYAIKIGVMTNPTDPATFVEIQTITLTSAWAQYSVPLTTYTGTGKFIAFKHANNSTSQTIYVDDVSLELIAANDLAAVNVVGNSTPSMNNPTVYTVNVFNNGTASQSTYSVKLYNAAGTELATAAGTTVAAGATVGIPLTWTPTAEGAAVIYGKVILAGDINAANNQTPNLNITVLPAGILSVTIGDGTALQRFPLGSFYGYERSAALYTAAEIGAQNTRISTVSWYSSIATTAEVPTKVYMKSVSAATLTTDNWANMIIGATLLYDSTLSGTMAGDWNVFPLTSNFDVDQGSNLMILVERNFGGSGSSTAGGSTAGGGIYSTPVPGTHLTWNADSNPPTTTGTVAANRPNISITYTTYTVDTPPNPAIIGSPANGATNVMTSATLNWGSGGGAPAGYKLYFGTTNPPPFIQNITMAPYTPTLSLNTQYFWKIIPFNASGDAANCPVWSFTTGGPVVVMTNGQQAIPDGMTYSFYDSGGADGQYQNSENYTFTFTATNPVSIIHAMFTAFDTESGYDFLKIYNGANTSAPQIGPTTGYNGLTLPAEIIGSNAMTFVFTSDSSGLRDGWMAAVSAVNLAHDLGVQSISGNYTPSVGAPTTYSVAIKNNGANSESNYTVKLMNSANQELVSIPGTIIAPQEIINFNIIWTPTVEGPAVIYAKVVLPDDGIPTNNQTPNLNITVMPAGVISVTIGDGSTNALMPLDMFYKSSMYQTLYYPDEIGMIGNILSVSIYNNFLTTSLVDKPTKIWMGTTTQTDLSAGWIPGSEMTLVFDGTMTYPGGENTIIFPLSTIFPYSGGNLVVMWNRPLDTAYFSSSDYFKCQIVGTNRAREIHDDTTEYDPNNMTGGTLTGTFPKTSLIMTPMTGDPLFMVNPATKDFGTVLINTTNHQSFSVVNAGGGSLTINSVTISGSPMYSLQNVPTLPVSLNTGQTMVFTGRYSPTAEGTTTATITITDNLARSYEIKVNPAASRENRGSESRVAHTVALSGNCIDTTINALPYAQAFDAVTAPALPPDWSSIYQSTETTGYVKTVTTTPQSAPNCVAMYSYSETAAIAMLIAPPFSAAIATNSTRVKFYAKGSATYTIIVGVMSSPTDATTFVPVQTVTLTSAWAQYSVPLTTYAGTGKHVAFKHGCTSTYQTIYIDDVNLEIIAPNDLAAISVVGNSTPSMDSATVYTVNVFNNGTSSQNAYSVKLYNAAGIELATAAGTTIAAGTTVGIPLTWTPTAEGPVVLYGKVILAGDINAANDQTPNLNITVMPAGILSVTIGDGSTTARMPIDMYYNNSIYQTLYYPDEMGMIGNILSLSLYNNFFTTTLVDKPTKIWMGTTALADLSGGWIPSSQMTLVFDGTMTYPGGENTITFPIYHVPYTGGNLVVMWNRPMDTAWYSSMDYFKCQVVGTNRARNAYSDSTPYDPNAMSEGTLTGTFPKTTLVMTPMTGEPVFGVTPATYNYVDVTLGGTKIQNFTVRNVGGGSLGINSVNIAGSTYFSITGAPTLPASLATGETLTIGVTYSPGALGTHTATLTINDNLATNRSNSTRDRIAHTVALSGTCINDVIVGDGSQDARMPLDFLYNNSLYETLIYPNEMSGFTGQITGIKLFNNFSASTSLVDKPIKIWIGTTTMPDLSVGWIPSTELTPVFDGTLSFPSGLNTITIDFPVPFLYINGENLVIMFNRPMDTGWFSGTNFKCQTVGSNRARNIYSDTVTADPATITGGTLTGQFPKISFSVIPGGVGHINGTVLGEGNQPLQGVAVQIANTTYSALTNADGYYQIHNILPNTYSISFSKYGYVSQTQTFTLEEDETEVINLTLVPMASVSLSGTILASDTAAGLGNVTIQFSGYQSYTATTLANGSFTIPAVYANQSYTYVASCPGYRNATGTVNVAAINHTIPAITLNEIAFAPYGVVAELNTAQTEAQLVWQAPNPQAVDVMESFEATTFPPTNWTQIINNTGVANDNGVLPTWCSFGTKDYYGFPAVPTNGNKQAGIGFVYSHQDEWLITHPFYCPPEAIFTFSTFVFRGSAQGDHYYVKISPDNGINWTVLWDATTLSGGYTTAPLLVTLNLAQYGGQQIKIAFHADDPATDDGLWYDWYIDNIKITNEVTSLSFNPEEMAVQSVSHTRSVQNTKTRGAGTERAAMATNATDSRALTGYKVWRLRAGQETNETLWNLLNTEAIPTPAYNDAGWNSLSNGTYRWAVKAIYTNGVASIPVLSNPLTRNVSSGTISGVVRKPNNQPLAGATVAAGGNSTITNSSGLYSLSVPVGAYSVTCTATGYLANTINNINVIANQSVTVNFIMIVSANEDEILPVTATTLNGNYPNPFNPETSISYAIKDAGNVSLEIFNLKGQRVRSLVHGTQTTGHYRIVFDGKDDHGQPLSSGVYLYRLTTGTYTSTRKMMLME